MTLESDNDPWTGCVQAGDLNTMEQDLTASPPQYGTHFDAPGLRSLGARYALKYLEMATQ